MGSEGSESSKGATGFHFGQWCFLKNSAALRSFDSVLIISDKPFSTFFSAQDDEMRRTTLVKPVEPFLQ